MSQRIKRGNHHHHQGLDVEPPPPPTKRRKGRPPNSSGSGGGGGGGGGGGESNLCGNSNLVGVIGINNSAISGGISGSLAAIGASGNSNFNVSSASNLGVATANSGGFLTSNAINSSNIDNDQSINNPSLLPDDAMMASTSTKVTVSQGSSSSAAAWQARSVADIKISSIYNRSSTEAPAELYRKDLISAMKLPDSEPLANYEYLVVNDQWKQEWEKGVQVPVNPDSLPEPCVYVLPEPLVAATRDFKLPKNRFLRITKDDTFSSELHCHTNVMTLAENVCAYDIDPVDEAWLKLLNSDRLAYGAKPINETQFERVIEELEVRCWEQIQAIMKNEEGLGIEYDENVICDVCRSPDSEEANEMVFCDNCNICVHQACYGITAIPSGQWLCRTCSMGIKPECVLCPNKGGAMKSTKSGKNWAHVSCALWIPEVSIGCVDRMEPITKISSIPQSRWALVCVLCRERVGACIQCSVKTCKTAYHVTCAFQHGLEMRAIIEEGNAEDGVKLRSYCQKHSVSKGKKDGASHGNSSSTNKHPVGANHGSGAEDDDTRRRKSRKSDMTAEERNQARAQRLQEVEAEFDRHVNVKDLRCQAFDVDDDAVESIYNYWKLKRKSRHNRALIPPKSEAVDMVARKQEQQDLESHKLIVHLRQDLERVRNLCYMVSRREKLSRSLFKLREQVFYKQVSVLSDEKGSNCSGNNVDTNAGHLDETFKNAVIYANDGPTLYDRFYSSSCNGAIPAQYQNLDFILEKLQGSVKNSTNKNSRNSTSSTSAQARSSVSPNKRKSSTSIGQISSLTTTATTSANSHSVVSNKNSSPNKRATTNSGAISLNSNTTPVTSSNATSLNSEKQLNKLSEECNSTANNRRTGSSANTEKMSRSNFVKNSSHTQSQSLTNLDTMANNSMPNYSNISTNKVRGSPRTGSCGQQSTTERKHKSSDESSQSSDSSGSSSTDEDDSSSEDGTSSASGSSGSGSDSCSSSSTSSSSDSEEMQSKVSPAKSTSTKKQIIEKPCELDEKSRRKNSGAGAHAGATNAKARSISNAIHNTSRNAEISSSSGNDDEDEEVYSQNERRVPGNQQSKSKSVASSATAANTVSTKTTAPSSAPISRGRDPLSQMEQELEKNKGSASSTSDESEELLPIKSASMSNAFNRNSRHESNFGGNFTTAADRKAVAQQIYSDSDSSSSAPEEKKQRVTINTFSDVKSQQTIRTKAAMKDFTLHQQVVTLKPSELTHNKRDGSSATKQANSSKLGSSKSSISSNQIKNKKHGLTSNVPLNSVNIVQEPNTYINKSSISPKFPADLVVPQRQAAKKASENMRSTSIYSNVPQQMLPTSIGLLQNSSISKNSQQISEPERCKERSEKDLTGDKSKLKDYPSTSSNKQLEKADKARLKEKPYSGTISTSNSGSIISDQKDKNLPKRGRPKKNSRDINETHLPAVSTNQEESSSYSSKRREDKTTSSSNNSHIAKSSETTIIKNATDTTQFSLLSETNTKTLNSNHKTPNSDLTKNNILMSFVPQRQAAKKAAEQLKSGTKITPLFEAEEERRITVDKEKTKVHENRIKSTPTRRMSTRESAVSTSSTPVSKTPISSRRRSKDTASEHQTTPKKGAEKRTASSSSSSESDSSSTGSSSGGSSSSSSETSDDDSETEEQRMFHAESAAPTSVKRSSRRSIDKMATSTSVAVTTETSAPAQPSSVPKISPTKHPRRNTSNEEPPEPKTQRLTRKSSIIDEKIKKTPSSKVKSSDDHVTIDQRETTSGPTSRSRSVRNSKSSRPSTPSPTRTPVPSASNSAIEAKTPTRNSGFTSTSTPIEIDDEERDLDAMKKRQKDSNAAISDNNNRKSHSKQYEPAHSAEKSEQSGNAFDDKSVQQRSAPASPDKSDTNSILIDSKDECGEQPMDIDEELTIAPTHTTLPSGKVSDLADIDDRPPAAPMPASPSPSLSNEEGSNISDASDTEVNRAGTQKRRLRRRRTGPRTPPISPEQEHTHHTQHLLNEMEHIRALEEERKNEIAVNASKYSASSSSPAVAVIAPEPPEVIELDSNSNSIECERLKDFRNSLGVKSQITPKGLVSKTSTPASPASSPVSSECSRRRKALSQHDNVSVNQQHSMFQSKNIENDSHSLTNVSNIALESGHQPIVDAILEMENEKQNRNKRINVHDSVNSSILSNNCSIVEPLSNSSLLDSSIKAIPEEEATRNLLEKLRKTKRNRSDEADLTMPPPTPAIPSVFQFHNPADIDDIIHDQKDSATSSHTDTDSCLYQDQHRQQQKRINETFRDESINNRVLPNATKSNNFCPNQDDSQKTLNIANAVSTGYDVPNSKFLDKNEATNIMPAVQVTPTKQKHTRSLAHGSSTEYKNQGPTSVSDISQYLQKAGRANNAHLGDSSTPPKSVESFKKKSESHSNINAAPDFVDLRAAAAKSNTDFTSSTTSVVSNKIAECDYDENTHMQSPYAMRASRMWNENDLIAARRSSSPSSVSESNDQPATLERTIPQSTESQQQQKSGPILSANNMSVNDSIATSSTDVQNCKGFFNEFNIPAASFSHHLPQTPQQHTTPPQAQQQSPLVNGIDASILPYNRGYNSQQQTTPTHNQAMTPQQTTPNQTPSNQYNGSVNVYQNSPVNISNMNTMPYTPNASTAAATLYPGTPGLGGGVALTPTASTGAVASAETNQSDLYAVPSAQQSPFTNTGFASATHNMSLSGPVVNTANSTPTPLLNQQSPHQPQLLHGSQTGNQFNLASPAENVRFNAVLPSCAESILPSQTPQHIASPTKESPSKRNSTRFSAQQQPQPVPSQQVNRNSHKSPQVQHKSPGKSPRQMELLNKQMQQQQQQDSHPQAPQPQSISEFANVPQKPPKYDPMTHTLTGKPRQRAPRGMGAAARGRGRGRGRGRSNNAANAILPLPPPIAPYGSNTPIVNNLVGTPYEFNYDEDIASPGVENLQSLRDRRRSFDCRNNQSAIAHQQATSNDQQKYTSPSYASCKARNSANTSSTAARANCNNSNSQTPHLAEALKAPSNNTSNAEQSILHSIVQPVLPGPVDMRTYNVGYEGQHSSVSQEVYNNNLLGAFDSGTADQTLSEFDEEDEREFQSVLRATGTTITSKQLTPSGVNLGNTITTMASGLTAGSNSLVPGHNSSAASETAGSGFSSHAAVRGTEITPQPDLQTSIETSEEVSIDSDTTLTTKASLSDSRNQLKLKIKGPLAYPDSYNYNVTSASSLTLSASSSAVQSNASGLVQSSSSVQISATTVNASVSSSSGTNSRRMRKKELLSLYVVQKDTHMDESSSGMVAGVDSGLSNTLDVMRKPGVDGLGSGLDDYGNDLSAGVSKRFKKNSGRELRSMDSVDLNANGGLSSGTDGRRRSGCSSGSNENIKTGAASSAGKRRCRSKTMESSEEEPTPKLKIKIRGLGSGDGMPSATTIETSSSTGNSYTYEMSRRMVSCPPKKRLSSNYTPPTLEDLRRESMNYRKMVMQDFGEDDEDRARGVDINKINLSLNATTSSDIVALPAKRPKSSKSKKEKKEKKRSKDSVSVSSMSGTESITTTLIENTLAGSPGEPPKLILRIGKRKAENESIEKTNGTPPIAVTIATAALTSTTATGNNGGGGAIEDPSMPTAPIRLKLARVSEGGGYVIGNKKRKHRSTGDPNKHVRNSGSLTLDGKGGAVTREASLNNQISNNACDNSGGTGIGADGSSTSLSVTSQCEMTVRCNYESANTIINSSYSAEATTTNSVSAISSSYTVDIRNRNAINTVPLELSTLAAATSPVGGNTGAMSDMSKDSSATPSPRLVIDASKVIEAPQDSNTACSLPEALQGEDTNPAHNNIFAAAALRPPTPDSLMPLHSLASRSVHATANACNDNSNNSSGDSNLTTSNSNNSNSNLSTSTSNNNNNNNNSNNNNNNSNSNSNSRLLPLNKDCEVR